MGCVSVLDHNCQVEITSEGLLQLFRKMFWLIEHAKKYVFSLQRGTVTKSPSDRKLCRRDTLLHIWQVNKETRRPQWHSTNRCSRIPSVCKSNTIIIRSLCRLGLSKQCHRGIITCHLHSQADWKMASLSSGRRIFIRSSVPRDEYIQQERICTLRDACQR